jgi:phosphatidylglycerol lysyltransferase
MFDAYMDYLNYFFLILVCFFIYYYVKKFIVKTELLSSGCDADEIISFLKQNGGNHASHLILLGDKEVYWAQQQKVLIAYRRVGNKLVVLGDPIGEESYLKEAIIEFNQYSQSKGCKPIFYQTSPQFMHYYHETGYRFLKLGEEGVVNLEGFSLEGKQGARLRTRLNKFNRSFYTFRIVNPPYCDELFSEIKAVSDSWLGSRKEQGFSVVSFSEEYVSRFPVALLLDPNDNIIAFATLAMDYKNSFTIDLMRKSSDSPHGTMDVLFIHIFKWAKENGYKTCSLGMSPLSNVGNCKNSFVSEKLIRLAYVHGNSFYNFKGLKEFKGKFASNWEPKYLAYKKTFLPTALLQLLILISSPPNAKNRTMQKIKYLFKKVG